MLFAQVFLVPKNLTNICCGLLRPVNASFIWMIKISAVIRHEAVFSLCLIIAVKSLWWGWVVVSTNMSYFIGVFSIWCTFSSTKLHLRAKCFTFCHTFFIFYLPHLGVFKFYFNVCNKLDDKVFLFWVVKAKWKNHENRAVFQSSWKLHFLEIHGAMTFHTSDNLAEYEQSTQL